MKSIFLLEANTIEFLDIWPGTEDLTGMDVGNDVGGFTTNGREAMSGLTDLNIRFKGGISVKTTGTIAKFLIIYS